MKKNILLAFILLMPLFNTKLFSQEEVFDNKVYVYKTCKDFLNGNKIFYGTFIKEGTSSLKYKIDSAGKIIKIDLEKMDIFAFERNGKKRIKFNQYIGGNKYVLASANFNVKTYDEDGYAESISGGLSTGAWWGIRFNFYKIDSNGNPTLITAPKRDNVLGGMEYISPIETLLQDYPHMYTKYMSEIKGVYKKNDAVLYVTWMMKYYKTYAETLKADKEKK